MAERRVGEHAEFFSLALPGLIYSHPGPCTETHAPMLLWHCAHLVARSCGKWLGLKPCQCSTLAFYTVHSFS